MGFTLEEIAAILDDPDVEARTHLRRQHGLLRDRIARLQEMVAAVEYMLEAHKVGVNLTPEEKFEVFGDFDPDAYTEEVEERWGGTDAYAESARRTARYTKDDWQRIQQESGDLMARWVAAFDAGMPAESQAAMDLAEEHRQQITKAISTSARSRSMSGWRRCTSPTSGSPSSTTTSAPGLAQYVHDAVMANAVARFLDG